jgi:serine/threonine protein kinase
MTTGHIALLRRFKILHRDLSPANLFLTWEGIGVIADFNMSVYITDAHSLREERRVSAR